MQNRGNRCDSSCPCFGQLQNSQEQVAILKNDVETERSRAAVLRERLFSLEKGDQILIKLQRNQITTLREAKETLTKEMAQSKSLYLKVKVEKKQMEERVKNLEEDKSAIITKLQSHVYRLEEDVDKWRAAEKQVAALKQEVEAEREKAAYLEQKLGLALLQKKEKEEVEVQLNLLREEKERCIQTINEQETEKTDYETRLQLAESQNSHLKEELNEYEELLEVLKREAEEERTEAISLKDKLRSQREENEKLKFVSRKMTKVNEENQTLKKKVVELTGLHQQVQMEKEQLEDIVQNLQEEKKDLVQQLQSQVSNPEDLEKLKTLEKQVTILKREVETERSRAALLKKRLFSRGKEDEMLIKQQRSEITKLREAKETLTKEMAQSTNLCVKMRVEKKQMEDRVKNLEEDKSAVITKLQSHVSRLEEDVDKWRAAEKQAAALKQEVEAEREKAAYLEQKLGLAMVQKKEKEEVEVQCNLLQEEKERCIHKIKEQETERTDYETKLQLAESEISSLKEDFYEYEELLKVSKREAEEKRTEAKSLKDKLRCQKEEFEKFKMQCSETTRVDEEKEALMNELVELNSLHTWLQMEKQHLEVRVHNLQEEKDELVTQLQSHRSRLEGDSDKLRRAEEEITDFKKEIEEEREYAASLKQRLLSQEEENDKLKLECTKIRRMDEEKQSLTMERAEFSSLHQQTQLEKQHVEGRVRSMQEDRKVLVSQIQLYTSKLENVVQKYKTRSQWTAEDC